LILVRVASPTSSFIGLKSAILSSR
jgi:hypothetical protein